MSRGCCKQTPHTPTRRHDSPKPFRARLCVRLACNKIPTIPLTTIAARSAHFVSIARGAIMCKVMSAGAVPVPERNSKVVGTQLVISERSDDFTLFRPFSFAIRSHFIQSTVLSFAIWFTYFEYSETKRKQLVLTMHKHSAEAHCTPKTRYSPQ